jgi:hypothetical protein
LQQASRRDFIEDRSVGSPLDAVIEGNVRDETAGILKTLSPRQEKVIRLRFGIGCKREHTLEEISQEFHLTRERIRQIVAKALGHLRASERAQRLRALITDWRFPLSFAKNTSAHDGSFSARIVESNAGHPSVCISVRSTAFQRSSDCSRREHSSTAATGRIQEKAEKTRAYARGPAVLGRHIPALERLAGCAGFCSTGHSRALATGTVPQVLGPAISTRAWSPRQTGHRRWHSRAYFANGCGRSPLGAPPESMAN